MGAETFLFQIDDSDRGRRLDIYLGEALSGQAISRSMIQQLIRQGMVLVNESPRKAGYRLRIDDRIEVTLPPPAPTELRPEKVSFEILYEDDDLLVLSKPPGIVVHPACGHDSGTLVHGLLHHCAGLAAVGGEERPGIVHRLDKDTSGVMVVAKNDRSHRALVDQFKGREVEKTYRAIVDGDLRPDSGRVDLPIGRHPVHRKKMAVRPGEGREAVTNWRVVERFGAYTFVELRLETGRTHQIRVHLAALGHPITGDALYGRRRTHGEELRVDRQCLHAAIIGFCHPQTGQPLRFEAPLWSDMEAVLARLRAGERG